MSSLDSWLPYLGAWYEPVAAAVRITLIIAGTLIAQTVANRLIRTFRERIAARMKGTEEVRRAETLGRVFRYLATVVIGLVGGVLVLAECGVSVAPILGAAGVVGLAVGFGAQSLVKDYFTGIFLLVENQLIKGDVVQVADKSGVVEDMTLRYVQLRDYDGNVHFVPNGLISTVTNMSRGYAYAVVDVGIAYREEIDAALDGHELGRRRACRGLRTLPTGSSPNSSSRASSGGTNPRSSCAGGSRYIPSSSGTFVASTCGV